MRLIRDYPLTLAWCVFILILCSVRMSYIPAADLIHIHNFDKVVHFLFFFILAFLIIYERGKQQSPNFSRITFSVFILCLGALYGGFIELLQKYIFTYRSAEWFDLLADVAGAFVAVLIVPHFLRRKTELIR